MSLPKNDLQMGLIPTQNDLITNSQQSNDIYFPVKATVNIKSVASAQQI